MPPPATWLAQEASNRCRYLIAFPSKANDRTAEALDRSAKTLFPGMKIEERKGVEALDALSEVLRAQRLSGGVFLQGHFTEPWCLASAVQAHDFKAHIGPADHLVLYHFVTEGALQVEIAGEASKTFLPGQAAILPRNDPHRLSGSGRAEAVSALDVARVPGPSKLMVIEHGGGGPTTRIVCGFLGGLALFDDPLMSSLPKLLLYDSRKERAGALVQASLQLAQDELASGRAGSEAMLGRLSELLFVEAVRSHVEALPEAAGGWLAALKDAGISRAITAMHAHPQEPWTVTLLAREAGMSRSAFAERFVRLIGAPPADYLARHRMRLAARQLALGSASLIDIAESVGYGSEAAFSRAFKRCFGAAPSTWRRRFSESAAGS